MRGIKGIPIVLAFLPGMAIAAGTLTPSMLLAHVTQYDHPRPRMPLVYFRATRSFTWN